MGPSDLHITTTENETTVGVLKEHFFRENDLLVSPPHHRKPRRNSQPPCALKILAKRGMSASHLIEDLTNLTREEALEFIRVGAVRVGKDRLLHRDTYIKPGEIMRIMRYIRRFTRARVEDWRTRIIFQTDDYVVVNKPAGAPVNELFDNRIDSVCCHMEDLLGCTLTVVHRLDVVTRGLVVLAKTPTFARHLSMQLQNRTVNKKYRALVDRPVSVGMHRAYTPPPRYQRRLNPKVFAHVPIPAGELCHVTKEPYPDFQWRECKLDVLSCSPYTLCVPLKASHKSDAEARKDNTHVSIPLYEVDLDLLTGRTHQIRGQLGLVNAPVYGDILYGWSVPKELQTVQDQLLTYTSPSNGDNDYVDALSGVGGIHGVALQSYFLEFQDLRGSQVSFCIGRDYV